MEGIVYKSTGSWYVVKTAAGAFYNARIKGKFKIDENITSTNPVTVGDRVSFEQEEDQTVTITAIQHRTNYINRQSPANKHQHHIIAANIDQALLVCTLKEPRTSLGFIDRFLITTEAYHVPAIVVFNKSDIYRNKELEIFEHWRQIYENIGYRVLLISTKTGEHLSQLQEIVENKTTLISGHSGVGKSSVINLLIPGNDLKTQEVSGWSGKGMHTTTFAEMHDLPGSGQIIDTPGIREFGLVHISRQELSHYFVEMQPFLNDCQFNNCQHINEPGCAVKQAVIDEKISEERYISYYNILESINEKQY